MDHSNPNEGASGSSSNSDMDFDLEALRKYFQEKLGFSKSESVPAGPPKLEHANIESIVKYIKSGECKNIIVMAGAGISTSAGIPDFRSPGSGLYDNLEKYKLPNPMAIFEIDYFRQRPEAFFTLAKELYPGSFKPTPCHYFIKLLHQKNLLLRHFTQNIDNLERIAGIPDEALVEAHGSFHTSHCLTCRLEYSLAWMKERIFSDVVPTCEKCNGLVKPDIVFFGENLPSRYFHRTDTDFPKADLLLIMGTSLAVQPFCSLVNNAPPDCPRLLINKEKVGTGAQNPLMGLLGLSGEGLAFDSETNVRDVFLQRDCDSGCQKLADMLGWGEELNKMVKEEHARLDREQELEKQSQAEKKLADQGSNKLDHQASSKTADQTSSKPADEASNKPADQTSNKPADQIFNKSAADQGDEKKVVKQESERSGDKDTEKAHKEEVEESRIGERSEKKGENENRLKECAEESKKVDEAKTEEDKERNEEVPSSQHKL